MSERICGVSDCATQGATTRGMCRACYEWSRSNGWTDPAGRTRLLPAGPALLCDVVEDGCACGKPLLSRKSGLCPMHYALKVRNGSPTARRIKSSGSITSLIQQAASPDTNECIIVAGWNRRPKVSFRGKQMAAARVVWTLANGAPADGVFILHRCNGGSGAHGCINLRHLYASGHDRNMRDMAEAGRAARGEDHPHTTLTRDQVRALRQRHASGERRRVLAAEFGVSASTVKNIASRRTWGWLD